MSDNNMISINITYSHNFSDNISGDRSERKMIILVLKSRGSELKPKCLNPNEIFWFLLFTNWQHNYKNIVNIKNICNTVSTVW